MHVVSNNCSLFQKLQVSPDLVTAFADLTDKHSGRTLVHQAASFANNKLLQKLLPLSSGVEESLFRREDNTGNLPVHLAAANNHVSTLRVLERYKEEPKKNGRRPIHVAAQKGNAEAVETLVELGVDPDAPDQEGQTALMLCLHSSNAERCMEALLDAGANHKATDRRGRSAITIAAGISGELKQKLVSLALKRRTESAIKSAMAKWDAANPLNSSILQEYEPLQPNVADEVRRGVYALGIDTALSARGDHDGLAYPEAWLLLALVYCYESSAGISSDADVEQALQHYTACLKGAPTSPLSLLAHARLASLRRDAPLHVGLLRRFNDCALQDLSSEWLSDEERRVIKEGVDTTDAAGEEEEAARLTATEQRWANLQQRLNGAQQEPMKRLMSLVGLSTVKEEALGIYESVLADDKLRREGHAGAALSPTLNFTFMGNPGTGKTTVARIFAELLFQAGARAGHKFVEMTGSAALRMGSKAFADELASLTGGKKGVGPPATYLRRGMKVEVESLDHPDKWFPARITNLRDDGTYDVAYTDETDEEKVQKKRIVALEAKPKQGGVLFLDEAYDLDPKSNPEGKAIMAELMSAAEDSRDQVTIILAGYPDDIERKLFSFNVGMASRFQSIVFDDFDEDQLRKVWEKYASDSGWESDAKASNVAARRIARGIGNKGFGNARDVRKLFESAVQVHFALIAAQQLSFPAHLCRTACSKIHLCGEYCHPISSGGKAEVVPGWPGSRQASPFCRRCNRP